MSASNHRKQIIIGSGAAGLTAAIYSARANLEPLVLEGMLPGGQLTQTSEVENFPGFEQGIEGPDLMSVMKKQAQRFGAEFIQQNVDEVDFSGKKLKIITEKETYTADSVIISTGANPKLLGLESENRFFGRGVSTCATCDAFFYRGKKVVVIGGGDSAMEEANFISKFASEVKIVHRRDEFRASKIMQDRVFKNEKIEVVWNAVVEEVLGDQSGVTGVRIKDVKSGKTGDIPTDGFFLAIGHTPNTQIFEGKIDLDDEGYIVVNNGTKTSARGVFAAGDCVDHVYRQAITAAGMGCAASLDSEKYLETIEPVY